MFFASLSAGTDLPMAGPGPPTFDVVKKTGSIASKSLFVAHAFHEHRAHHAAPTYKANDSHTNLTTAEPISVVVTGFDLVAMSAVRRPDARALRTALSMRPAISGMPKV